jgi:hypothetical protein
MIVTAEKTHKRKRSQQERNEKLAKKLTTMRTKRARRQLQLQQAEQKTEVEPTESEPHVELPPDRTLAVHRRIVDVLEHEWNANDADEDKREKNVPAAWNMNITDVKVGDFVVLEATYGKAAKGISVAQVGFFCLLSLAAL